jgi:hypothetical protein
MWSKVNLVYLVACASVLSLRMVSVKNSLVPDLLIWILLSLAYSFYLSWVRSAPRFWRGLVHFLSILTVAQVFSFLVYFVWFGVHQIPPFRGSAFIYLTQENTTLSALVFALALITSLVVAVICYAIGYPASRRIFRR